MKNKQVVLTKLGGPENYEIQVLDLPDPAEGEVCIKIEASGIAYADLLMRRGLYPGMPKTPFTQGYDIVGTIEKIGVNAGDYRVGDRVASLIQWGGYAQYINLPATKLVPVQQEVDPAEALCLVLNYTTAYQMFFRYAKVTAGQTLLIQGAAGGVGTALLQLSKANNAKAYGTVSPQKKELVEKYGAIPIDYKNIDVASFIKQHEQNGLDAFFGITGGRSYQELLKLTRKKGIGVIYSLVDAANIMQAVWYMSRFSINNTFSGRHVRFYSIVKDYKKRQDEFKSDLTKLFEMLARKEFEPVIAKSISLEQVADTHRDFQENKFMGKVVILPNG